jgi:hypothetical protein
MVRRPSGKNKYKHNIFSGGIHMAIRYICPHCGTQHAAIEHAEATEDRLGFHFLTPEERKHIISYEANGDTVASVTCEYCSEAIYRYPELMYPLQ